MIDLLSKFHLDAILPALLIANIVLSAISQILEVLKKAQMPWLAKLAAGLKKVIDFISANQKH